jgi:hypothetical protein
MHPTRRHHCHRQQPTYETGHALPIHMQLFHQLSLQFLACELPATLSSPPLMRRYACCAAAHRTAFPGAEHVKPRGCSCPTSLLLCSLPNPDHESDFEPPPWWANLSTNSSQPEACESLRSLFTHVARPGPTRFGPWRFATEGRPEIRRNSIDSSAVGDSPRNGRVLLSLPTPAEQHPSSRHSAPPLRPEEPEQVERAPPLSWIR